MIIIVAARNNEFKYRRIPMTCDFTRIHKKVPEIADDQGWDKSLDAEDEDCKECHHNFKGKFFDGKRRKIKMYGKKITSHGIELKMGGSTKQGIYV